jgi:hypothetical protein
MKVSCGNCILFQIVTLAAEVKPAVETSLVRAGRLRQAVLRSAFEVRL